MALSDNWFSHCGDLGDLVYALPAIKAAGGGTLYLFNQRAKTREPMTQKRCDVIRPLLVRQDYIADVVFKASGQQDHKINGFRDHLRNHKTLAAAHCAAIGVPTGVVNDKWLEVDPVEQQYPVLFARSVRYRNRQFDWKRVYNEYKDRAAFIGLPDEYEVFKREVGIVPHLPTANLLEVAQFIAGCKLFVGNQSCPLAIAHGLHAPVIQEVAPYPNENCNFPRANLILAKDNSYSLTTVS